MKNYFKIIRDILYYFGDLVVMFFKSPYKKSDVLIIRLDAIGDFIVWLDSAKEYRGIYNKNKITLLANEAWAELAKNLDYWDEVIPVNVTRIIQNPLYRWRIMKRVRSCGYSVVIQTQLSRVFLVGDSIVRVTDAPERIGSVDDMENSKLYQKRISDHWYTRLLPLISITMTEAERNAGFISEIAGILIKPKISTISVLFDLPEHLRLEKPYFVIFPGASASFRQWPPEKFVEVMRNVYLNYNLMPVLCGSYSESSLCSQIEEQSNINTVNYAGKTTLPQFIEVVRNAKFLIGNETSAVHIAAAVGTPSICILGGGHYGRFVPYSENMKGVKPSVVTNRLDCYNCNWKCIYKIKKNEPYPCIKLITVNQVVGCVKEMKYNTI